MVSTWSLGSSRLPQHNHVFNAWLPGRCEEDVPSSAARSAFMDIFATDFLPGARNDPFFCDQNIFFSFHGLGCFGNLRIWDDSFVSLLALQLTPPLPTKGMIRKTRCVRAGRSELSQGTDHEPIGGTTCRQSLTALGHELLQFTTKEAHNQPSSHISRGADSMEVRAVRGAQLLHWMGRFTPPNSM